MTGIDVLPNGITVDTHALTRRVRRRDLRAFFPEFAKRHPDLTGPAFETVRRGLVRLGVVVIIIGGLALGFGMTQEIESGADDMPEQLLGMSFVMVLFVVAGGLMWWWTIRDRARRGTPKRHYRLAHFAADNQMAYLPGPALGGHLEPWAERGRLMTSRVMRMPSPEGSVEFGNYELSYAMSSSGHSQFGGYCALRLDRRLPNIVVRAARRHNPLTETGLPARAQRLSLEGDFDRHFTLYCPEGYERDALYLFTPDVMARLIDRAGGFDVEIIDDWVFLSQSKDVVTLGPKRWRAVVVAVSALRASIAQWERWRDDRLLPEDAASAPAVHVRQEAVTAPGRRLRPGQAGMLMLLGVAVALIVLLQLFRLF